MLQYKKHRLDNGLTLIVAEDRSTPLVSVNTLYNVGARDESPERTGFAHLFEHLMFGGTQNVPDFDKVVSEVGGDSNANTCNDFTQYYITVPAGSLETVLWLESDRMRQLDFSPRSLAVQQSVVTEEYNYRYMNQPYGDVWLLLRPLCYKVHPYRWCTIGADIRHVQEATLADVENFFNRYYCPDNAIIAVVGNVKCDEVVRLVEKMYGDIPSGNVRHDSLPVEPPQTEARELEVKREVPANALYMAYPMCGRLDEGFAACDLISDMLSNGRSSRLYNSLVKNKALFSEVDAYITGDRDPGLFVVSGRLNDGVGFDAASGAVSDELREIAEGRFDEMELEKVKNKYENTFVYSQYKAIDCAMSLCYYEWLGHAEWVNEEPALYREVSKEAVRRMAERMFKPEQLSMLRIMK